MDWNASWIWLPATDSPDNVYAHFRATLDLDADVGSPILFVTASSLYKLYVNGTYVGRGPNPADPSHYYYDSYEVGDLLRRGRNTVCALCYNYGPETRGVLGQNWGPGGFLLELRDDGDTLLATDSSWRALHSPVWRQDVPLNCTLYGDFKEVMDTRAEPAGWLEADFDDGDWPAAVELGKPPLEPWTGLVPREIPFLGGERVWPVNAYWESASVTYSWRDDWEVYDQWSLAPGAGRSRPGKLARVQKTHDDFDPSLILDFGRDVTGYPEITVAGSEGGVVDVLYGEDLFLTRVDTFTLRGGRQVLQPYNRRTFRYMKLLFRETPEPIELEDVSMEMNTYPVEPLGSFRCSDPLLNRIWDVGAYSVRMSMLDHFIDCPWRERTIYGGDLIAENLIAHYAFGDPRLTAKTLRQMAAIQYEGGALPPYGPYRGCDGFYPAWSAHWGLALLDHYDLTGDYGFLEELWPNLRALLEWAIGECENEIGLIGSPSQRPANEEHAGPFEAWMAAPRERYEAWGNYPFCLLLKRSAAVAAALGLTGEADRYGEAGGRMARALREHMVDADTGLSRGLTGAGHAGHNDQYHNALYLWSSVADNADADRVVDQFGNPNVSRIGSPFHGLFVLDGLYRFGRDQEALDFTREYWGDMLERGATTWWEHFSQDWPPGVMPDRGTSLCHGWGGAPTYALPAYVLGVRPAAPGFARVLVEPRPTDLAWAEGTVPTPHGAVRVRWERTGTGFDMELTVPEGCVADVRLPLAEAAAGEASVDGQAAHARPGGDRLVLEVAAGTHCIRLT